MYQREYWLYQKRNVPVPWALYIVKSYDKRYRKTTVDWTVYHEDLPTKTHSKSFFGLHYATPKGYADAIVSELVNFFEIEASDYQQIEREMERVLL